MSAVLSSIYRRRHLIFFVYRSWGQIRPLCNLAAHIVKLRTVFVTFFTTATFYDRVQNELKASFASEEIHRMMYIRVVALQHNRADLLDNRPLENSFAYVFEQLVYSEPIVCTHTGMEFQPLCAPDAVFLDFQGRGPLADIRRLSTKHVKVFVWFAGAPSAVYRMYGPERIGGIGDLPAKSEDLARRTEVSVERAAGEIALGHTACLMCIPGLPPIYDYEVQPQRLMGPISQVGEMMLAAHDTLSGCDGIVLASPECYEQEATATLKEWFATTSRSVCACGPVIPGSILSNRSEKRPEVVPAAVEDFLQTTMASNGERSLIYISFGTVYWPLESEKLSAFLDVVIAMKIPFLLNHASPYLPAEDSIVRKATNYKYGWFLTHGGHSSVIESISEGVPMICWPFAFNHSLNAVRVSEKLQIGYELLETRNGPGLRRAHRLGKAPEGTMEAFGAEVRDVLRKAFGEDGVRKHRNVQRLKREVARAWEKRGSSRRAVESLLASLGCSHGGALLSWLS